MRRAPLALWLLTIVVVLATFAASIGRDTVSDLVLYAILPLNMATVGALVVTHASDNRVGWVFLGLGVYVAAFELVEGYGLLAADTSLPDTQLGQWTGSWAWIGEVACWTVIVALFPQGRPAGRRWRWVPWTAAAGALGAAAGMAFGPWSGAEFRSGSNPFLIDSPLVVIAYPVGGIVLGVALAGAAGSLFQRLRHARGVERQQLKWFAYAASLLAAMAPVVVVLWSVVPLPVVPALSANLLPLAAGIAILRHGLYDIDLVIKRTLVYSTLTVAMVVSYVVLVLLLQIPLRPLSGRSDLAVAASTLAVAALFRPLRTAIQHQVDRRFFRAHYDAGRTMADFTVRLRHDVDLDSLGSDLRDVVRDSMQPTHVSLWLRSDP